MFPECKLTFWRMSMFAGCVKLQASRYVPFYYPRSQVDICTVPTVLDRHLFQTSELTGIPGHGQCLTAKNVTHAATLAPKVPSKIH